MYKKIAAVSIVAVIALVLVAPMVTQAAGPDGRDPGPGPHPKDACETTQNFLGEDGDGLCDNQRIGVGFIDEDGDGVCDNSGSGIGFVDEDGDGVCDNQGTGEGFVDEDGDGNCDNLGLDGLQQNSAQTLRNRTQ